MSPWCLAVDVLLQTCQARARDSTVKVSQRGDTEIVRQTPQFGRRIRPIVRLGYARQHVGRTSAKIRRHLWLCVCGVLRSPLTLTGTGEGAENTGPENAGPKMKGWKMQDRKMWD